MVLGSRTLFDKILYSVSETQNIYSKNFIVSSVIWSQDTVSKNATKITLSPRTLVQKKILQWPQDPENYLEIDHYSSFGTQHTVQRTVSMTLYWDLIPEYLFKQGHYSGSRSQNTVSRKVTIVTVDLTVSRYTTIMTFEPTMFQGKPLWKEYYFSSRILFRGLLLYWPSVPECWFKNIDYSGSWSQNIIQRRIDTIMALWFRILYMGKPL